MSLINDALKKAQKQRTGEAPTLASMPGVGGESAHRIARRAKPTGFNTMMARAGMAGGAVLLLAVGAFFVLRGKPETGNLKPERQSTASQPGGSPLVLPSVASGEGRGGGPSASSAGPTSSVTAPPSPVASPPSSAPAPVTFTLKTDPVVVAEKAEVKEQKTTSVPAEIHSPSPVVRAPSPEVPAAPAAKLEPRAITYIENLKVAGIRASATDAKVLMNDRVYRIGSTVEAEMGLKLVDITANSLTFEDDRGGRYTRVF